MMTVEEFNKIDKLYHYTSFCSALQIVISNTLLFNPLKKMNDINELYRPLCFREGLMTEESLTAMRAMVYGHQQISLSRDSRRRKGFDIPALWGHYADKGKGVCLVLDKEKMMKDLPKGYRKGNVIYVSPDKFDPDITINKITLGNKHFTKAKYKEYFFKKTSDWSYEQEYRVLVKSDSDNQEKLDLKDSLIGAIMYRAEDVKEGNLVSDSLNYSILQKVCPNIYSYEMFGKDRLLYDSDRNAIFSSRESSHFIPWF